MMGKGKQSDILVANNRKIIKVDSESKSTRRRQGVKID